MEEGGSLLCMCLGIAGVREGYQGVVKQSWGHGSNYNGKNEKRRVRERDNGWDSDPLLEKVLDMIST